MAGHTAEHGDLASSGRGSVDQHRATARRVLDHPGPPSHVSPPGRGASQAQRGVVGGSRRVPTAGHVPTLRQPTVRIELVLRPDPQVAASFLWDRIIDIIVEETFQAATSPLDGATQLTAPRLAGVTALITERRS